MFSVVELFSFVLCVAPSGADENLEGSFAPGVLEGSGGLIKGVFGFDQGRDVNQALHQQA